MSETGKLYLIPNLLGGEDTGIIPMHTQKKMLELKHFIVERERESRRFLKKVDKSVVIDDLEFHLIPKKKERQAASELLMPCLNGEDMGLLSDAGCPAVADPGADIVRAAHTMGIPVVPLVGPSSILMALMASGLGGQRFEFHGYLPIEKNDRTSKLKYLEGMSMRNRSTQIFMETPYRNESMLQSCLSALDNKTWLSVSLDLSLPTEEVITMQVADWRKWKPVVNKRPAIFVLIT